MTTGKNTILDFESARSYNRHAFLLNEGHAFSAYSQIDQNFERLAYVLSKGRDKNGKSYVSLIPFILLMRRQALNAFWSLCGYQSFEGWILLRPCLESALIIGKWIDDPETATIWRNREKDRDKYAREYSGKRLRSKSLLHSDLIQSVLSRINDDFMHANPKYYQRHTKVCERSAEIIEVNVDYFDDDANHEAHLLAFLNLVIFVQRSLSDLLASLLIDQTKVNVGFDSFQKAFSIRYNDFMNKNPNHAIVVKELGLWKYENASSSDSI